jgi:hypothetical protein
MTATATHNPTRRRIARALAATFCALTVGVLAQSGTASAQASYAGQTGIFCGAGRVTTYAPTIYGEQGWVNRFTGYSVGGTASWVAEVWKYDYSTRTWKYVVNTRSATLTAQIATGSMYMGGTTGMAGPNWYGYGGWTNTLTWNLGPGTYFVKHWVSDGLGTWVSQNSGYCYA